MPKELNSKNAPVTGSQYKQEYLSTLYTADTLYGVETYRPEAGFIIAIADE